MSENIFLKAVREANLLRECQAQVVPSLLANLRTEDGIHYTASCTCHRNIDFDLVQKELASLLKASSTPSSKWICVSTTYDQLTQETDYRRVTFTFKSKLTPLDGVCDRT